MKNWLLLIFFSLSFSFYLLSIQYKPMLHIKWKYIHIYEIHISTVWFKSKKLFCKIAIAIERLTLNYVHIIQRPLAVGGAALWVAMPQGSCLTTWFSRFTRFFFKTYLHLTCICLAKQAVASYNYNPLFLGYELLWTLMVRILEKWILNLEAIWAINQKACLNMLSNLKNTQKPTTIWHICGDYI
jgi:hypothetical protein